MILVYLGNDLELLKSIQSLNFDYKLIGDGQSDCKMKDLLIQDVQSVSCSREPFLYLDGLEESQMKKLDACVHVKYVAVSTATNLEWTLSKLMNEVQKEYHYFLVRNRLYQVLIHPDKERLKEDTEYLKRLSYAYSLYEHEKTPVEILEQVLYALR